MLLQVCNRCRMACPHCLDNATPDGGLMDSRTAHAAVAFAVSSGVPLLIISGGEPSEHPKLLDLCRLVSDSGLRFSLCTNGMWLGDQTLEYRMERIARLTGYCGSQVYTNPKWYRFHVETVNRFNLQSARWQALGFNLDTTDIRAMLDIGRARDNPQALEEARQSPYHNSCLAACVTLAQTATPSDFFSLMTAQGRFCTPLIDWKGDMHMSESCLCPSCGNVNTDTHAALWDSMRRFRPCGGCLGCKRYLTETTPKMIAAREILGQ